VDNATKLPYYPCGLIANSIFNDTFQEPVKQNPGSNENTTYAMPNTGISWSSDKDLYKKTAYKGSQIMPPPNWVRRYPNYTHFEPPNLSLDEGFQVWMRTAGLPAFSKLARRNDKDVMARGTYELVIWDGTLCQVMILEAGARTKTRDLQSSTSPSTAAPSPSSSPPAPSWEAKTPSSASPTSSSAASAFC
jgi:hypothetical protein